MKGAKERSGRHVGRCCEGLLHLRSGAHALVDIHNAQIRRSGGVPPADGPAGASARRLRRPGSGTHSARSCGRLAGIAVGCPAMSRDRLAATSCPNCSRRLQAPEHHAERRRRACEAVQVSQNPACSCWGAAAGGAASALAAPAPQRPTRLPPWLASRCSLPAAAGWRRQGRASRSASWWRGLSRRATR